MTTIRTARTYDAPALAELAGALGYSATRQAIASRLAGVEAEPASAVLVAEDADGRVVGWLHVAARTQLTESLTAEILGLVVAEASRSAGVGAALIDAAERWAIGAGCAAMRVRSRDTRERAHRFYERHGYARVKTQVVLVRPLADEVAKK